MREICLDEGILQSYLDGELSLSVAEQVAGHVAACRSCAELVSQAESELALFNTAFAEETAWAVPTEQLRVRINTAIDALEAKPPEPFQQRADAGPLREWLGALAASFALTPQRAAGFASLIALVAFGLIFAAVYKNGPATMNVRDKEPTIAVDSLHEPLEAGQALTPQGNNDISNQGGAATTGGTDRAASRESSATGTQYKPAAFKRREKVGPTVYGPPAGRLSATPPAPLAEVPGEKSYLKTIASLTTAIDTGATAPMKPTLRVEYERNLALVNQAIAATRPLALRKPGDAAATQFLYSAYQSKIELLSAVADQQSEAIARR